MSDDVRAPRALELPRAEELALLVDSVQDYAIFLLAPDGTIRTWNHGARRLMGYESEDIVGRHFSIFYPPEDVLRQKPQNELLVSEQEGRVEDEGWRIRKDGTRFWVNTIITPLRGEDGVLRGFAKVTRDLSERRAAEERLRHSEEMFRLLVASVKDYAIFMLDPQGRVATWNAGAQRIKQYRPEEIIGKHFSVFYPPEDRDRKPAMELEIALRDGSVEDEGWRLRKDGTRFWANVVITAVFDERGALRGFAKVTRDVTSRREAEETRRALLEQREARVLAEQERRRAEDSYRAAQEANRAKDEFLMTLSHELRTPMTAILGWARLLPTLPVDDKAFHDAINAIARSAQLQAQLIDDVLDVSRIASGKLRLNIESVEVVPVLQSSLDSVRASADAKQITVTTAFEPNLGAATFDATRLQQIVWNLLTNAIKFTPKRGRVELSARRTASQLQICVSDNGEGIDPQFLPHVFEPFRQAETPSTRVHGGLGLGLSIVRYLVEAHGGRITAESQGRGQGARFVVTLPIRSVRPAEPELPHRAMSTIIPKLSSLSGRVILVVDDDPASRELVATVLRNAGAEVNDTDSALAALVSFDQQRPDLVLTDIAMPGLDGYAFYRELVARGLEGVRVAALTAFPPTGLEADTEGFDLYLRKPIDPFELTQKIAELFTATGRPDRVHG